MALASIFPWNNEAEHLIGHTQLFLYEQRCVFAFIWTLDSWLSVDGFSHSRDDTSCRQLFPSVIGFWFLSSKRKCF